MSTNTINVPTSILRWAANRADLSDEVLSAKFKHWHRWIMGDAQPTLRQLEKLAQTTHTAIGYFFLSEPPQLPLPIADFRTTQSSKFPTPSANLIDTIYLCQQRQDWYRDHARLYRLPEVLFVGTATTGNAPNVVANEIRNSLQISVELLQQMNTSAEALRLVVSKAEDAGVMVMNSSIVGSNSHRKLQVEEFRGFTLADALAPLVFINGADSKSAQLFTIVHELAHLWLGESGVIDGGVEGNPSKTIEHWCNQVTAEVLVPMDTLRTHYITNNPLPDEIRRLAQFFNVSTLVIARRLLDATLIAHAEYTEFYNNEVKRYASVADNIKGGGDFYRSLATRTSRRFTRAVLSSTLEGMTSFTEAYHLLGIRKTSTFYQAARKLEVVM